MSGVIKMGMITLPVTNRTATAHLKSVTLRGFLRGPDWCVLTLLRYLCVLLRASKQLAAEPVRWLPYWRLLLCQLLLLSIRQHQQEQYQEEPQV